MKIRDALDGITRIFLDTAPVIDALERHPRCASTLLMLFSQLDAGV